MMLIFKENVCLFFSFSNWPANSFLVEINTGVVDSSTQMNYLIIMSFYDMGLSVSWHKTHHVLHLKDFHVVVLSALYIDILSRNPPWAFQISVLF